MKAKRAAVVAIISAFCLLFSSCGSGSFIRPVSSLISPPLYYEEYEELVKAFNENVGSDAILCSPGKGNYRSAIIVEDVDSDGEDDALIFYKTVSDKTTARMQFFQTVDGRWISRNDFSGYGNGVESVTVTDMDGDGNCEIIVNWNTSGVSSGNVMSLYRTSGSADRYKEILNEMCSVSEVIDIDGDGAQELFFISQSNASGVNQRTASAMRLSGDTVVLMGETKVDPNISSYVSVKTEKVSGDAPMRIYVDALKGESMMITELIFWDDAKSLLLAPLLDEKTLSNAATVRYEPIPCADINNDGIIDIPVQSVLFGKGDDTSTIDSEVVYLTSWTDYDDSGSRVVANTLINSEDRYMIYLDDSEINTTGIRNYRSQSCWVVYRTDGSGKSVGEIYSVLKISKERWNPESFSAYIPISENDDGVVCVYITQNGKDSGIDEEYVKSKITDLP